MKLVIAITLIALLICGAVWIYKKFVAKIDASKETNQPTVAELTAQSLINIHDYFGRLVVTTEGVHIAFIKVEGHNNTLATDREKEADIERVALALGAVQNPYRIHIMQKPVDATVQLTALERQIEMLDKQIFEIMKRNPVKIKPAIQHKLDALKARKELIETVYLPGCIDAAAGNNEKFTTEIVISMPFMPTKNVREEALQCANEFVRHLSEANYQARLLDPDEIKTFLINYHGRYPKSAEVNDPKSLHVFPVPTY